MDKSVDNYLMANCFNHADKEGIYICCKCWLSFCSSCFDQEDKVCKSCAQKTVKTADKTTVRRPVLIFATICSVLALLLLTFLIAPRKPKSTDLNASGNKIGQSKQQKTVSPKAHHFIIEGILENKKSIVSIAEGYYRSIPIATGLPPGENLGLDEIKINIFASKDDYVKETGKPSWSEGYADYKSKEIFITQSDGLEKSILPHEISHLFFDSYMEYENPEFNWLDEGLATLVQVKYDTEQAASFAEPMQSIRNNGHIPLTQLTTYALTQQTPESQINKYYAQSLSITHYLFNKDLEKWKDLLAKLKSKKKFNQALKEAFELDLNTLEQEWLAFIKVNKQDWEKD